MTTRRQLFSILRRSANPRLSGGLFRRAFAALSVALPAVLFAGVAAAQTAPPVVFTKSFAPATIGPGGVSTLTFSISNSSGAPVTGLAFTDTLPAGMTIAAPADAGTNCGSGLVAAPSGGTTISLSAGQVPDKASCSVTVNVTSSTAGTSVNVSGDLTSSIGNSGPAQASLTIDTSLPGFTKRFSPATITVGGQSTLIFTIENFGGTVISLNFADEMPSGMVVATPSNASTDCGDPLIPATLTAVSGTGLISLFANGTANFPALPAESTCSVSVDVTATIAGSLGNVSGELTSTNAAGGTFSSGRASAVLVAERDFLTKVFVDDPIAPGGTGTLRFTLTNYDRTNAATGIAFTDDLNATLAGLAATGLPGANPCGPGSSLTGTSMLVFSGGSLPPEGSCTFDVTFTVPGERRPRRNSIRPAR